MNNKGFTLIELLGVIILISLITLILLPMIDKAIKQGDTAAKNQNKNSLVMAAKNWATDNKNKMPSDKCYIDANSLITAGYLDKNNSDIKGVVIITKTGTKGSDNYKTNIYRYKYQTEAGNIANCQI